MEETSAPRREIRVIFQLGNEEEYSEDSNDSILFIANLEKIHPFLLNIS